MTTYLENSNVSVVLDLHVNSITPASGGRNLDLKFQVVCGDGDAGAVQNALRRLVDQCPDCLGSVRLSGKPHVSEPEPMLHLVKSATYKCQVMNSAGMSEVESRVDVVGGQGVPECPASRAAGVEWATTPVDREALLECSVLLGYTGGLARRQCVLRGRDQDEDQQDLGQDLGQDLAAEWEEPDFHECVQEEFAAIRDNFARLTLGYANTTALKTLEAVRRWLEARADGREEGVAEGGQGPAGLRPREGEPILALAVDVAAYQRKVLGARQLLQLREELFKIVDLLLQSEPEGPHRSRAVQDNMAIEEVQALVREQALLWASSLPSPLSSASSSVSSSARSAAAPPTDAAAAPPHASPAYSQMDVHVELRANIKSGVVREGDDFILSCVARGATSMQFSWYKDGVLINASLARRNMLSQVQSLGKESTWSAVLVVEGTSPMDAGRFTCRVRDAGSEQCRSVDVHVLSPPRLAVRPLVHTVRAGANVTTCCYTGAERLGVTWAKNHHLLALSPGKEVEEDLVYPPGWVGPPGSRLRLHVSKALAQRSVVAAVVAFKSLHKLLPERSVAMMSDSTELEYELASSLVSVSLGSEAGDIINDVGDAKDFSADVVFLVTVPGDPDDSSSAYLWPRWAVNCAVADIARGVTTPGKLPWNTSACSTLGEDWDPHDLRPGSFNLRCNCTLPGTMAVLLSSNTSESAVPLGPRPPVALVSGLALCALQAATTTLALLPRWLGRPSCMVFLKLQSAAATSASAGIFLAGLSHAASSGSGPSGPGLVAALHCCLLTALAAHLGKLLLLYTELVGVRPLPHLRQSLLAMVAGAPLVGVLCGLVAARSTLSPARLRATLGAGWAYSPWGWAPWAPWGSRLCSVLVATAAVILVAFGALLCAVVVRLATARPRRSPTKAAKAKAHQEDKIDVAVLRRWGLVKRACCIVLCQVCVVALSIAYVSVKSSVVCFAFSAAAATLGAVTLFCYIVKPEDSETGSKKLCGGIFTKQDAELESDAAAVAPDAPVVEKEGEKLATSNGKHVKSSTSPSKTLPAGSGSDACTCHVYCTSCSCTCKAGYHAAACAPLSPARYVPMCPVAVHVPVHIPVPVVGAPPGSVLGVGKEASLLVAPPHEADAFPLQDMAQRSPNKYLYMRCRPYRAEDSDEYVHHDGEEARGREEVAPKYARTLYHNDWPAMAPRPGCPVLLPDQPLRPEPVPCYIRGEPGVPVVASPTRRAPPPPPTGPCPRGAVLTCKADVEPVPRPSPPPAPPRAPTTVVTPPEDSLDEDVLNKISHDLDYLLSGDATPAPPSGDAPSAIAKSALPQP
ncbi:hypothetical protein FOCC_FOCC013534 [Frankliniella occidentalis]|nr:hypothetical protein FOCC_FOCC013534 [Frankliniella occidentalis]